MEWILNKVEQYQNKEAKNTILSGTQCLWSSISSNSLVCETEGQGIGINTSVTPYGYTVEVRNRFKELDLIECLMIMYGGS